MIITLEWFSITSSNSVRRAACAHWWYYFPTHFWLWSMYFGKWATPFRSVTGSSLLSQKGLSNFGWTTSPLTSFLFTSASPRLPHVTFSILSVHCWPPGHSQPQPHLLLHKPLGGLHSYIYQLCFLISKTIRASVQSVTLWWPIPTDIPPCTTEPSQSHRGSVTSICPDSLGVCSLV